MGEGEYHLAPFLTVVAILSGFGLSTGVVVPMMFVFLFFLWRGLGGRGGSLELTHARFGFIDEADIFEILHNFAGRLVVVAADGAGPKIGMTNVG
jgi:hypothetical protein